MLKTIQLPPSNCLITYYETLDEVIWPVRQEKLNKRQTVWKNFKIAKFYQNVFKIRMVKFLKTNPLKLPTMQ